MESKSDNPISRKTFLKYGAAGGLFFSIPYRYLLQESTSSVNVSPEIGFQDFPMGNNNEMGIHHKPDFVDVYYDFDSDLQPKEVVAKVEGAEGFWDTAENARKRLVCETHRYKAIANLERPGVDALYLGEGVDVLGENGIWIEVEDDNGVIYSSRNSVEKARQNTWRAGLYYYDAHLLDFELADRNGEPLPVSAELIFNCFPDKLHVEALFRVQENMHIRRAELKCDLAKEAGKERTKNILNFEKEAIGIIGGDWREEDVNASVDQTSWNKKDIHQVFLAFLPETNNDLNKLEGRIHSEENPLDNKAFEITNGVFKGYDPAKGYYRIKGTSGASAHKGFAGFLDNPNMYLSTDIEIHNNSEDRSIYVLHESPAGPVEAGILTDFYGFPLPVQVQACKNFNGENEERADEAFSESYYPLDLKADESIRFRSLHIHHNWGNHALRQLSSIRFFQIYYHLSQGVTETTCFSLPTKFGSTPSGDARAYTLADYRPLSGQTWPQSPQHHHVALQGWLQYRDEKGRWRYPHYKGSTLISVGPNLVWFIMKYISSDGKVEQVLEFFEMPQNDESRTFMRCRYNFRESVTVQGDMRRNMRLINKGTFIRKVQWNKLSWRDPSGKIKTKKMTQDGRWSAEGIPLRPFNSFFCAYPHIDGNESLVVRQVRGAVNGKAFQHIGFSAVGHEDGKTELMLVPLVEGNTIEAGSSIELDCILMPYGDDSSSYYKPMEESTRFGLNSREYEQMNWKPASGARAPAIIGPQLQVTHGERIQDLPPVIRVKNNWAEFTLTGGHDQMSLAVTGFESAKLPMLWKGKAFMDPQVRGGDGYQVMKNPDGTHSAVFVIPAWTTRSGHEWGTRTERYYATQVVSGADIAEVSSLNGEVELNIRGKGESIIQSPRFWYPAENIMQPDMAINTAKSKRNKIKTAPVDFRNNKQAVNFILEAYDKNEFGGQISTAETVEIACRGLHPNARYLLVMEGKRSEIISTSDGVLDIEISKGRQQSFVCRWVEK